MSYSNYPPGVSGNEWQIVGLDERPWTHTVICGYASTGFFSDGVDVDWECSFEGEVEGLLVGDPSNGFEFWYDCPECKTTDRSVEVDYDELAEDLEEE